MAIVGTPSMPLSIASLVCSVSFCLTASRPSAALMALGCSSHAAPARRTLSISFMGRAARKVCRNAASEKETDLPISAANVAALSPTMGTVSAGHPSGQRSWGRPRSCARRSTSSMPASRSSVSDQGSRWLFFSTWLNEMGRHTGGVGMTWFTRSAASQAYGELKS